MKSNVMYSRFGNRLNYCWRQHNDRRKRGKEGRISVYYGGCLDREIGGRVSVEYCVLDPVYLLGGHIELGDSEDPLKIGIYLWPFSLYINADTPLIKRIARRLTKAKWDGEREIALHLFPRSGRGTIRWKLWSPVHSWSSDTPKWRDGHIDFLDAILGRWEHSNEIISTHDVVIPMPEQAYPAVVTMERAIWRRARFPFIHKGGMYAKVDIPNGIPHEGKGENSWDCGEDAIYGLSRKAETLNEAIGATVSAALRNRLRYGGSIYHRREEPAAA